MSLELLDPHMWSLKTLFKNVYKVPVYQRPYSWDKEQIDSISYNIGVEENEVFSMFESINNNRLL